MKNYSKAGEQYCCVVGRNVILEETEKNGKRFILHCMNEAECERNGGCKNRYVKNLFNKDLK